MKIKIAFLSVIVLIGTLIVIGLGKDKIWPPETKVSFPYTTQSKSEPMSPIETALTLSAEPLVNQTVELIFSFKSSMALPNAKAEIVLPKNFELVSGLSSWQGNLKKDEQQKLAVKVKAKKPGFYRLIGTVGSSTNNATAFINLEITPDKVIIGSRPQNNWYHPAQGMVVPEAMNNENVKSELIISNPPALGKEFTISYQISSPITTNRADLYLVFPPKAFKLVDVQFPPNGKTYTSDSQLSWVGKSETNQVLKITAVFKVINTGWGEIYGNSIFKDETGNNQNITDAKIIKLYVDKYTGEIISPEKS